MKNYKSWKALKQKLEDLLCDELKGHITYFLTRYHKVHDSYGRAAIVMDKTELVRFSWIEMYNQESDMSRLYEQTGEYDQNRFKDKWDEDCTYYEMDFIAAALEFTDMKIRDALCSDNYIIRIFAVMDRRVGKRTLQKIKDENEYAALPDWVSRFYKLRLEAAGIM